MTASEPIKILYTISSLANEGPTRVLLNMVRNLDRNSFAPAVATFTAEKENSLLSEFQTLGVPVYPLAASAQGAFGRFKALRDLLRTGAFRIAHSHCPRSLFFLAAARVRGVKTAYTVHVYPDVQYRVIHGPVKGPVITAGSNVALRFIDKPIACADSVAAEYLEKRGYSFPAVNNGIEPMSLDGYGSRNEALAQLGLDPRRRYLLSVGRLSGEKRIGELAETFARVNPADVDLVVVGAGPEEERIAKVASPRIHLMGFHKDIRPFLAACDFYVSPSSTEGLANTLLETMSVGMPSLLSDIPSHRFVIQKCQGFVGCMFDPLSDASLLAGLQSLMQQDTDEVRASIRRNFQTLFHAQVMTRGYEAIYREMVA
ncbi:glycosyltransferase [Oryzibacter oryziterrae]|uniref:glycosyltransferase n=1 Tax=Oryzibacter oryziterrae TaxID=2766474 RepID=UPI001F325299|nr:glycosyltransferase [Oryzibacter oryziterrae]